jgi:hypothetical protein
MLEEYNGNDNDDDDDPCAVSDPIVKRFAVSKSYLVAVVGYREKEDNPSISESGKL